MPAITDRSKTEPLLKTVRLGHGTLECVDIVKTRRFYEEVLGLEVIQTIPLSLMIRKGTTHTYAVVETGKANKEMPMLNHNGLDVGSPEEVDAAYELLQQVKDAYGIRKIQKPRQAHGDYAFFFCDLDGNWWEIVAVRAGGYAADFGEDDRDLTGRHELDALRGSVTHIHTHDAEFRATLQKQLYRDPAFRAAFRKELETPKLFTGRWDCTVIHEVSNPALQPLIGKSVAEIARERGKDGLDTFLDLAIEDELRLQYSYELFNATEERIAELITDPRVLVGLSDGGAHVNMLCDAGYCTYLLGTWVREKGVLTLEQAIRRLTAEPAAFYGVKQRGQIQQGFAADFAIFDPDTVGSKKRGEMWHDLPGGGRRLVMPAQGVEYTIVNGAVLYEHGQHTEALPGQVLRSGAA